MLKCSFSIFISSHSNFSNALICKPFNASPRCRWKRMERTHWMAAAGLKSRPACRLHANQVLLLPM